MNIFGNSRYLLSLLSLLAVATVVGCGGGPSLAGAPKPAPITLSSITISDKLAQLVVGQTEQLSAVGSYSDGSTKDLTSSVNWNSSDSAVLSVQASGLATASLAGFATVTASLNDTSTSVPLSVVAKSIVTLQVSPVKATVFLGSTQQFTAVATYNDGSSADITSQVVWTSSPQGTVTVAPSGVATGATSGDAEVTATIGSQSGSAQVSIADTTSGFLYNDDLTDELLYKYLGGDGSLVSFFGDRDASGQPLGLQSLKSVQSDGTSADIQLDSSGRILRAILNDGSRFDYVWSDTSHGTVIATSSDRKTVTTGTDSLIANTFIFNPRRPATRTAAKTATVAQAATGASPTETVTVTSCDKKVPEDGALVTVSRFGALGPLGDPVMATSLNDGTGRYVASFPSTGTTTNPSVETFQNNLQPLCDFISKVNEANSGSGIPLAASCITLGGSPSKAAACEIFAGVVSNLEKVCKASSGLSKFFTFENSLNYLFSSTADIGVIASLNGAFLSGGVQQQPLLGPYADIPIDFGCITPDHSEILPNSIDIPVQTSAVMSAAAFDTSGSVLQSSGFDWTWGIADVSVAQQVPLPKAPSTLVAQTTVTGKGSGSTKLFASEAHISTGANPASADIVVDVLPEYAYIYYITFQDLNCGQTATLSFTASADDSGFPSSIPRVHISSSQSFTATCGTSAILNYQLGPISAGTGPYGTFTGTASTTSSGAGVSDIAECTAEIDANPVGNPYASFFTSFWQGRCNTGGGKIASPGSN